MSWLILTVVAVIVAAILCRFDDRKFVSFCGYAFLIFIGLMFLTLCANAIYEGGNCYRPLYDTSKTYALASTVTEDFNTNTFSFLYYDEENLPHYIQKTPKDLFTISAGAESSYVTVIKAEKKNWFFRHLLPRDEYYYYVFVPYLSDVQFIMPRSSLGAPLN